MGASWARRLQRRQRSEPMSGRGMVRPPKTWHDMGLLAAGFGLVAISSAGVLAVGPRVMSHASFSGISVGVLISVVFGFGVATPTEQLMSRRQNAGDFAQGKSPAFWLGICASVTALAVVFVVVATDAGHRYAPMTWSVLAVLGWYLVSPRRGDLLGRQRVPAYALTMIVEGTLRLLLVLSAAIWRDVSVVLLGLSIGLPIVVSAGSAQFLRDRGTGSAMRALAPGFEHVSFVAIALGYQVALNLPPVALSWKVSESDRDFVGAFVVANSWMRLPTILVGSITVSALVELFTCGWSRISRRLPTNSRPKRHRLPRTGSGRCLVLWAHGWPRDDPAVRLTGHASLSRDHVHGGLDRDGDHLFLAVCAPDGAASAPQRCVDLDDRLGPRDLDPGPPACEAAHHCWLDRPIVRDHDPAGGSGETSLSRLE